MTGPLVRLACGAAVIFSIGIEKMVFAEEPVRPDIVLIRRR